VAIFWRGDVVARLSRGRGLLGPRLTLHRALDALAPAERSAVEARLDKWLAASITRHLQPLVRIAHAARDKDQPPPLRALLAPLAEAGGATERRPLDATVAALDKDQRAQAARLGLKLGTLDLYVPALLKPEAMRWRAALVAVREGALMPILPAPAASVIATPADLPTCEAQSRVGFRPLGAQMLRIDLAERLARLAHDKREGRGPFAPDPALATSLGLRPASFAQLMLALGFRPCEPSDGFAHPNWVWRGPRRAPPPAAPRRDNAFAALAALRTADG
jgi:ATP-dependent RNA helicase SUPV3L1/SUV3